MAQRGNLDRRNVNPVVKITAESPFSNHLKYIPVRNGHQAKIHAHGCATAEPFEFLLLEEPQQLGLQLQGNVSHFVEKIGSFVGQLEAADIPRDCPGEGAPFMTEQFAFQQSSRSIGPLSFMRCGIWLGPMLKK
jgi:hypothetical protein